jgi:antitoxin HicB
MESAMLSYPARVMSDDRGRVIVTFPDVPEATSSGDTEDAAFDGALFSLERALADYEADGRALPAPSDICGAPSVQTLRFTR